MLSGLTGLGPNCLLRQTNSIEAASIAVAVSAVARGRVMAIAWAGITERDCT